MSVEEDPGLIPRFQAGEESALEAIIELHQAALHRFIYRYLQDRSEAEDILSSTFAKAWQSRSRYRPQAKFQTWLFAIAGNLCRDFARKRKRRPGDFAASSREFDAEAGNLRANGREPRSPSQIAEHAEENALLWQAIGELPHDWKSALILFSIEGHSQEEAGRLLGCSAKAIENRVNRARMRLRQKLRDLRGR